MDTNKTTAPLIEFHGFMAFDATELQKKITDYAKDKMKEHDSKNLAFTVYENTVYDIGGTKRPFLRFYSSEYALVHMVIECLRNLGWKGEVEFVKITQFWDLRD